MAGAQQVCAARGQEAGDSGKGEWTWMKRMRISPLGYGEPADV